MTTTHRPRTRPPHGPELFEAKVVYPVEEGREILARWRDAVADAGDAVTSEAAFWTVPAVPAIPEDLHKAPVLVVVGHYAGPAPEGREALAPLRALGAPIAAASAVTTHLEAQRALDPLFAAGRRHHWTGLHLDALDDAAIDLVTEHALQAPSPHSLTVLRHLGGVVARVPADATAFGDRSAPFHLSIDATWDDPAHDVLNVLWALELLEAARPFSSGKASLDFAGMLEDADAALRATLGRNLAPRPRG